MHMHMHMHMHMLHMHMGHAQATWDMHMYMCTCRQARRSMRRAVCVQRVVLAGSTEVLWLVRACLYFVLAYGT